MSESERLKEEVIHEHEGGRMGPEVPQVSRVIREAE